MRIKLLIAALLLGLTSHARDLLVEWDANPETDLTGYRVYERTGVSPNFVYTRLAETVVPHYVIADATPALHVYVVTAYTYYPEVEAELESGYSNSAWWAPRPGAPTTLRVTLTNQQAAVAFPVEPELQYVVQSTEDFSTWMNRALFESPVAATASFSEPMTEAKRFYRVQVQ